MFLSNRARIACAKESGVPAEDVLRLVHPKDYVKVLEDVQKSFASQAAFEGLEFVRMMSSKWQEAVHPTFAWKRKLSLTNDGQVVSDRASGVLKTVVDVIDTMKEACRKAVFGRKVLSFRIREMYVGLALKLCKTLVPLLPDVPDAVDMWMDTPWQGDWPFDISCKGCRCKPGKEGHEQAHGWCTSAGCLDCRRHVVLVIRGVTQLACRLQNVDNPSCTWLLRATHSSDESRFPFEKRRSEVATARRMVRGCPENAKSVDWWPGSKAELRPAVETRSEEPMAEPSDTVPDKVVLRKSLSKRANPSDLTGELHAPPLRVQSHFRGEAVPVPKFPLCVLGMTSAEIEKLSGRKNAGDWWDVPFHMGRVPFDSKYCAVWHALFESFAPVERVLAPVFRLLIRARAAQITGGAKSDPGSAYLLAFRTAAQSMDLGVQPDELQSVLQSYVHDLPQEVVLAIASKKDLVGSSEGQLVPYGVIGGMVFAMVTRASYYSRLTWFQSLDWNKLSSMLRGLLPHVDGDKKSKANPRRGFDTIVDAATFEIQHALLPVQPDDQSRVWGVNSFAVLPTFGRPFSEEAAQQSGFRMPAASFEEKGNHSGVWLAVTDPDATVTVPGTVEHVEGEAKGQAVSSLVKNAAVLGKLFVKWFGNCTKDAGDTQSLVKNAMGYAERYKLEVGLKRCHSRVGVHTTRAGWFARDYPSPMSGAEWYLYEALSKSHLPLTLQVEPYRITESMPASPSLRGSLDGHGLVYQYVARIQALVQLLVEVWLTPTVRYSNRVAITEVLTRAMEACYKMICSGSLGKRESVPYSLPDASWSFNTVLDNVVFTTVFGTVVNEPTDDAGMLQVLLAGTAPGVGEYHYAFPSDCFAWSARDRSFIIVSGTEGEDWSRACSKMVNEWEELERSYIDGDTTVHARWMSGGPVRAAIGGIGGNRWLLMVPEPITAELWRAVSGNLRNVKLTRLSDIDGAGDADASLAQRAKQPSAGGIMKVFSSKTGMRRNVEPWGEEDRGSAQPEAGSVSER